MPVSLSIRKHVARITAAESESIFRNAQTFLIPELRTSFREAVEDVCVDRLVRADCCLLLAKELLDPLNEEKLRASIGRSYYSVHHSIRCIALWENNWDPDGHEESLKQLKLLLSKPNFLRRSGLSGDEFEKAVQSRNNSHVADYSPYDEQRSTQGNEEIKNGDWETAAYDNIDIAEILFRAATKTIGL